MSEQATEAGQQAEVVEIPLGNNAAFSSLMDALAPEPDEAPAAAGDAAAGAPAADGGQPAAPAQDAGTAGQPAAPGAGGGSGQPAVPGDGSQAAADPGAGQPAAGDGAADAAAGQAGDPAGGAAGAGDGSPGDRPATWTQSAADFVPKLGELSNTYESKVAEQYQAAALEETKQQYGGYFAELEKHPRLLVGQQVPALDGSDRMETIRDTEDAKEWQEAVKSILVQEVRGRASKAMEDNADLLNTVHASIELFQNNVDLIPGTKDFDTDLANRFATLAQPYELRVDGKLHGYTVPVQPLINQLRTQLTAERAAKTAAPPAPAAAPAAPAAGAPASTPATPAAPVDQPQAGIPAKAGNSTEAEDFASLWGTLGLPNLRL